MRSCLCMAAVVLVASSVPTSAASRDETIEILESIPSNRDSAGLEIWLNDRRGQSEDRSTNSLVLGDTTRYGFYSRQEVNLIAIHIDPHGVSTVIFPTNSETDGHITAGSKLSFPSDDEFTAAPPIGQEDLFVFAIAERLSLQDIGFPAGTPDYPLVNEDDAVSVARNLKKALAEFPPGRIGMARLKSRILGRSTARGLKISRQGQNGDARQAISLIQPDYTVQDVVDYFTLPKEPERSGEPG